MLSEQTENGVSYGLLVFSGVETIPDIKALPRQVAPQTQNCFTYRAIDCGSGGKKEVAACAVLT